MRTVLVSRKGPPERPAVPRVEERFCIGCGVCALVCPVKDLVRISREEVVPGVEVWTAGMPADVEGVREALEGKSQPLAQYCARCGRCVEECPSGARAF